MSNLNNPIDSPSLYDLSGNQFGAFAKMEALASIQLDGMGNVKEARRSIQVSIYTRWKSGVVGIKAGDGEHALSRIRAWSISWILVWCGVQPTFAAFAVGGGGAYSSALAGALSTSVESVESVWFNPAPS